MFENVVFYGEDAFLEWCERAWLDLCSRRPEYSLLDPYKKIEKGKIKLWSDDSYITIIRFEEEEVAAINDKGHLTIKQDPEIHMEFSVLFSLLLSDLPVSGKKCVLPVHIMYAGDMEPGNVFFCKKGDGEYHFDVFAVKRVTNTHVHAVNLETEETRKFYWDDVCGLILDPGKVIDYQNHLADVAITDLALVHKN